MKPWRHLDIPICIPFSWTLMMLAVLSLGEIWNFIKEHRSHDLDIRLRGTKGLSKRPTCIVSERA